MGAKANGRWESDRPHAVAVSARELRAGELGHPPDDVDRVASAAMHPATMFPFFSPKKEGEPDSSNSSTQVFAIPTFLAGGVASRPGYSAGVNSANRLISAV